MGRYRSRFALLTIVNENSAMTATEPLRPSRKLLKSKFFWVGVLYFAEGFPLGVFYDVIPVYFRQQGVELWKIGFMSLLGLAWTLKFLWAPAVDHFRHHRLWMFSANWLMAGVMLWFALQGEFGSWVWFAVGLLTLLSATNDIAIDGYTIEMLNKHEMGRANGLRIAFYRVGMLASGFVLIFVGWFGWSGAYIVAMAILLCAGLACRAAPPERDIQGAGTTSLMGELKALITHPAAFAVVISFLLGVLWLVDRATGWSAAVAHFWGYGFGGAVLLVISSAIFSKLFSTTEKTQPSVAVSERASLTAGPMFGTLLEMLQRPYIVPVLIFILIFKLADSSMGFMIKPFWVDAGFSAGQIGLVSVNIGIGFAIAGGIAGGWYTDRVGIFRALWVLGLLQAVSNLGYAWVASVLPLVEAGTVVPLHHQIYLYAASATESFTGGLGTAAFLAFLMAIVNKRHAATEYALLSSVFALSRSVAGWAGGFGAQIMGYADYFLLTFFLAFPAYFLLPWVKKMMHYASQQKDWGQEESR